MSDRSHDSLEVRRRKAILAGAATSLLAVVGETKGEEAEHQAVGPILGHVDHETALIWYRPATEGELEVTITNVRTGETRSQRVTALRERDLCVMFRFDDLEAGGEYRYVIARDGIPIADSEMQRIRMAPSIEHPARTLFAMGSCASSTDFFDVWTQIAASGCDGLMLLGDTPYIDNQQLSVNRMRHREFLSIPTLAQLGASTPVWGTWDDHDFGGNDTDGTVANKQDIRRAFTEYRAQVRFGDGERGVYTKFRRGPVEVFLIDPRYFSQTEPSPVDPDKPTCLGRTQWQWLLHGLKQSTAHWKLLATGMIWDDKKNREKDDWETYSHEREAIFDFIGENKIGGVVLIGGDIHVSRHLKYPMKDRIGYELHQFIISPLHDRVIPSLNVPHPHLQWGEPLKNMFLTVAADSTVEPPTLEAKWMDRTGKVHRKVRLELEG